jgi:hypothetical protein
VALFGRRQVEVDSEPTVEQLLGWHLLLVPAEVTVEEINNLISTRFPDANLPHEGRAQLGRQSAVSGPYRLDPDELDELAIAEGWTLAYAFEVGREPDPDAFLDIADPGLRTWWMRAFPQGKPFREEGDAVDLALEIARRVGGELRVGDTHAVMCPDSQRWQDLTVWSGDWLDPQAVFALLSPDLPGLRIDVGQVRPSVAGTVTDPWTTGRLRPVRLDTGPQLSDVDKRAVIKLSDEHDAWALQEPQLLDGYGLVADGNVVIEVIPEETMPGWVRQRVGAQVPGPQDPLVTYKVRWLPADRLALESEDPPYSFRLERDRIGPRLRTACRTIAEATAGAISDEAGFEVDRYSL